jgi:ADP-ribose pyrophosphatase YjhB (NUDIX family)
LAFSKDHFDQERFRQLEEIAAQMIAAHSVHSKVMNKVFSAESGYVTPKLAVTGAVFRDDKILMVKERGSENSLPGGYIDINESLPEAVECEVLEESGLRVKARKIAAVFDLRKHGYKAYLYHFCKIYIVCDPVGGVPATSLETSEIAFFSKTEIADLQLDPGRITRVHALRMFEHQAQPSLPADFD